LQASAIPRWKAIAAGSLAVVFWGASFVWIKGALRELGPLALLTLRFAIGTGVVWVLAWRTAPAGCAIRRAEAAPLAALGLLGVTAQQTLQTTGIRLASVLLAWPLLGEHIRARQAAGLLTAFLGAGLVSGTSALPPTQGGSHWGALLVLGSAVLWALYSILGKALSARHPPIVMTAWGMTFGWLPMAAAFLALQGWRELSGISASTWLMVVLLGVASTGLAYGLYFYALSSAEAALATALQYLEPLVTMAMAAVLLGERLTSLMFLGGALILGGVWIVDRAHAPFQPSHGRREG
jgi:drug/metabolite transporter (DMT)-like permease